MRSVPLINHRRRAKPASADATAARRRAFWSTLVWLAAAFTACLILLAVWRGEGP